MSIIVIATFIYLSYIGLSYYSIPIEERFYHPQHDWFKPSGTMGHGLGIAGTLMILFGVAIYIIRKRYNFLAKYIRLKYLLEFHIFLCLLGPICILFHTAFKFGGIVSIAFWSMVAVVLSGVIGRFIYIQIPRTIEGRELSLDEIKSIRVNLMHDLENRKSISQSSLSQIRHELSKKSMNSEKSSLIHDFFNSKRIVHKVRQLLKSDQLKRSELAQIMSSVNRELSLSNKIQRLQFMQRLFKYWHVVHLPFALIMLLIVVIHVAVTLALGYTWII